MQGFRGQFLALEVHGATYGHVRWSIGRRRGYWRYIRGHNGRPAISNWTDSRAFVFGGPIPGRLICKLQHQWHYEKRSICTMLPQNPPRSKRSWSKRVNGGFLTVSETQQPSGDHRIFREFRELAGRCSMWGAMRPPSFGELLSMFLVSVSNKSPRRRMPALRCRLCAYRTVEIVTTLLAKTVYDGKAAQFLTGKGVLWVSLQKWRQTAAERLWKHALTRTYQPNLQYHSIYLLLNESNE